MIDREGVLRWEHRATESAADRPTAAQILKVVEGLKTK